MLEAEGRADDRADGMPRVQRRVRVLEDHLDVPPERPHLAWPQVGDVVAVEDDLPAGGLKQTGQQAAGGRLAASRLSHQPERLALADAEVKAVDRPDGADLAAEDDAACDGEVFLQPGDREQGAFQGWRGRRGHRALAGRGSHGASSGSRARALPLSEGFISEVQSLRRSPAGRWQATR